MSLPFAGDPDWNYNSSKPLLGIFIVLTYDYLPNSRIQKHVTFNWYSKHITSVMFQDRISKQERHRLPDILDYIDTNNTTIDLTDN